MKELINAMRTTIDVDDNLMRKAMRVSELTTKKAVVDAALRLSFERNLKLACGGFEGRLNGKGIWMFLGAGESCLHGNPRHPRWM